MAYNKKPSPWVNHEMPAVTVLICTRNRGTSILATIRSVLANTYANFKLLIIDQSSDQHTAHAVAQFHGDQHLRYIHTNTCGKSWANNIGLSFITTDIVIMTDDDCEVPPDWISAMVAPFMRYPQVGVVFCDVAAAPHDTSAGWIPISLSSRALLVEDLAHWQTCDGTNIGIGAGMAIRRSAAKAIGGFDSRFGPGAHFHSAEDLDFSLNALAAGYQIYRTTVVGVIHYGFRTYAEGRLLTHGSLFGIGAVYGQLLRRGHWICLRYYVATFIAVVVVPALKDLAHAQFPRKLGRAFWLLRGFGEGLRISPLPRTRGSIGLPTT
jgi:glycosyltransferase involved in cell wall biosynthesis